jgi:hypothetical protein
LTQYLICRNADHYDDWYAALNMRDDAACRLERCFPQLVALANADDHDGRIKDSQIFDALPGAWGHTYHVIAVLLMAAGAAMRPTFKQAVLSTIKSDTWARNVNAYDRRFVMSQFWKLVEEYDVNGGHAIEYVQEHISELQQCGTSRYNCDKGLALVDGGYTVAPASGGSPAFVPILGSKKSGRRFDPDFFPMKVFRISDERLRAGCGTGLPCKDFLVDPKKLLVDQPEILSIFSEVARAEGWTNLTKQQLVDKMRLLAAADPNHVAFEYMQKVYSLRMPEFWMSEGGVPKTPEKKMFGDNDAPTSRPVPERVSGIGHKQLRSASGFNHNKICAHCSAWRGAHNRQQLMECSDCRLVYYCNKECQKADWKNRA